ncbi:MAG: MBL fold metallo-hydrolase [Clostridia bacterium]|nr:MBL fold metallo-hydrolase [Clostridia bacterium]
MFNFCSLYSGSSGNSLFVESDNTKLLIDTGESAKKIIEALENINVNISDINAILVTHEHLDHVKGLGTISKKYNIPVFANSETWNSMPVQENKINPINKRYFKNDEILEINDLKIFPFSIPHDAANPCGFNISKDNTKISIATDLGHIDERIMGNLENSCFILLESNYEDDILKCSSYPYPLKRRILGPKGHLSNTNAGDAISHLLNYGLKHVMLGHLSKENNFPELAYKTVIEQLIKHDFDENSINLSVAKRFSNSPLLHLEKDFSCF